jgi:protein ImuB
MELQQSFVPERSFKLSPLGKRSAAAAGEALKERPSYLFAAPQQVNVITLLPDHSPSLMVWNGERLKITTGSGPERILNEWWRDSDKNSALSGRDYFKVQDAGGRWLWLYRDLSTLEWFVHGVWM